MSEGLRVPVKGGEDAMSSDVAGSTRVWENGRELWEYRER